MSDWKLLPDENVKKILGELSSLGEVWLPYEHEGKWKLETFDPEREISFPSNLIDVSAKALFFPKRRPIATFNKANKEGFIPVEPNTKPRFIVGLKPCDITGIEHLDRVFLNSGYEDALYKAERERSILLGMACTDMGANCHCTSRGITPDQSDGMDAVLVPAENGYLVKIITEKAKNIPLTLLENTDQKPAKHTWNGVEYPVPTPEKLLDSYNSAIWDDVSDICLTCGACSQACPTCTCFSVADEQFKGKGERVTLWDSCQFHAYSRMAGGHNPRRTKRDRLRNRTLDKFAYSFQKYGKTSCTGCGRCVAICPLQRSFPQLGQVLTEAINK